jgi:Tol biopolymer transport system component
MEVQIMFWNKKTILLLLALTLALGVQVAKADFTFGVPTNLGPPVNSPGIINWGQSLSPDGLSLYITSNRPGGQGRQDIWVTTRSTKDEPWGEPVNLGFPINTSAFDQFAKLSADSLTLYFSSTRSGGIGPEDLYLATRETTDESWGEPVNLGPPINSSTEDWASSISTDGLELFFVSDRPGGSGHYDLWVTKRTATDGPWTEPINLGQVVNSSGWDGIPCISADGLCLFFDSSRPGGSGDADLWMTTRPTVSDPWVEPVNLGPTVNSSSGDYGPSISADGSVLHFASERPGRIGRADLYQVSIEPVVDLNGDRIVDSADMCIIVDHWGTDNSLCDIGPMPWGDGKVDVQDLIVLTKHLFEDYRLVAHWALDETEGDIAYDNVGNNDGNLNGNPNWQPVDGMYDGALELDGVDDYMSTPFILNPGKSSLSTFAWIKGSANGQVIISQTGDFGGTLISTNPSDGKLMTGFSEMYFGALVSETVVTDGQWHHVGFEYDMDTLHRRLYVDGVQVAEDTTFVSGMPSGGGLYVGTSKDLDAGTFFSGLIDDVRIYNVALSAEEIKILAQ